MLMLDRLTRAWDKFKDITWVLSVEAPKKFFSEKVYLKKEFWAFVLVCFVLPFAMVFYPYVFGPIAAIIYTVWFIYVLSEM